MYSYPSAAYSAQPSEVTYGSGVHERSSSRSPSRGRSHDNHHGPSYDENSHEHSHGHSPHPSDWNGGHHEHGHSHSHEQEHGHGPSQDHNHSHEHAQKPSHDHAHEHSQSVDSFPLDFTFPPQRKVNGYALPARSHGHSDRFSSHLRSHSITIMEDTSSQSQSHSHSHANGHSHSHSNSHLHSHSHSQHVHHDDSILCTSPRREPLTLSTISAPLLISLTYLVTEYASKHHHTTHSSLSDNPLDSIQFQSQRSSTTSANLLSSFSLVAGTLLLSSVHHRFKFLQQRDDSGGGANGRAGGEDKSSGKFMPAKHRERVTIFKVAELGCGLLLPYFAALELGGVKTALFSLAALVGGVSGALRTSVGWRRLLGSQRGIAGVLCTWIAWEGITAADGDLHAVMIAYIALLISTLFFESPFASPAVAPTAQEHNRKYRLSAMTAAVAFIPPLLNWMFLIASLDPDPRGPVEAHNMFFWWWLLAVGIAWAGVTFANVKLGSSIGQVPFAIGSASAIASDLMLKVGEQSFWALADKFVLVGAVLGAIYFDTTSTHSLHHGHDHDHDHDHDHHGHSHEQSHAKKKVTPPSRITLLLISASQPIPLLHSILIDRNSRRIFYFMCLNFSFMIIQTIYGLLTGSLGLLSDSIHMLFDCLALLLGLFAAVMSKYPPSARFPYGLGKMDTLAGFANGIFLMLISVEIVLEAIERLVEPVEMKRIGELLIVSSLGLAVNLVGIWAFDHAHHHPGHSHGHSHSHSHGSDDGGHGHSENMHGIFLHILADTLGSVAVVISTLLVQHFGWPGFDPLASVFIAVMIFVSAIPLVLSSAGGLLLAVPSNTEYTLREILSGISGLRGVVGCCVPRFWTDEVVGEETKGDGEEEGAGEEKVKTRLVGVVHVQVAREVMDLSEVRERVEKYLAEGLGKTGVGVDVLVQVERVSEGGGAAGCWCGGGGAGLAGPNGNGVAVGGNNSTPAPVPIGLGLYGPISGLDGDLKAR